jgi:N,N'-diacetyllegionaminate synthase
MHHQILHPAKSMKRSLQVGSQFIGDGHPCFITYEAGPTHDGLQKALALVDAAAEAGAQAIKFQIFYADQLVADKQQLFSYSILKSRETGEAEEVSEPLYEILKRRQLTTEEWKTVKARADHHKLAFFATIGFESDLELLQELRCDSVKIASADVNHYPLLRLAARSGMCVQLDTGSAEMKEITEAVAILEHEGCSSIIIHQCPSGYPARLPSICLNMITTLRNTFPHYPIAYSDHTPEADMDIAAVALGANLVEKTITLDRCTPSVEHIFSLEPHEMKSFIRRLRDVETALGQSDRKLTEEQLISRRAIRRSPYLIESADVSTPIQELSVQFRRPGFGLDPAEWEKLCQTKATLQVDAPAGLMLERVHFD